MEFTIPIHPEDLLIAGNNFSVSGHFDVESLSETALKKTLEEVAERLSAEPTSITGHENFDVLFSYLSKLAALSADQKNQLLDLMCSGLVSLTPMVKKHLVALSKGSSSTTNEEYKCSLKMHMFLLHWFIQLQEKANADIAASTKVTTKAKRGKKAKGQEGSSAHESVWESEEQKERVLTILLHILELDLARIWKLDVPEEDFVNMFSKICYLILESPSNTRSKAVKKSVFLIVAQLVKKYNHALSFVTSAMHMIHNFEHLPSHLAEFIEFLVSDNGVGHILGDVMREVSRINAKDVAQDSSGAKNVSAFVVEVAERLPKLMLPNMSLLLAHLDGESYTMRNGVVQVIGCLISKAFAERERVDSTRDNLIGILLDRCHDIHAYTRSKVLQIWATLFQERVVPLKMVMQVLEVTIGRLEDKTNAVRKSAIHLLITMLQYNPYHSRLALSFFEEKIKGAKQLMSDYMPASDDSGTNVKVDKQKLAALVQGTPYETMLGAEVFSSQLAEHLQTFERWATDAAEFVNIIQKAVPLVCQLLGSKNISDVLEAIQFFVTAKEFSLQSAQDGILKMLTLIWSKEANVKEALIEAFKNLYIIPPSNSKNVNYVIAKNLIGLTVNANLGELTSLEELVTELTSKKHVTAGVVQALWDIFAMKVPTFTKEDSRGALIVLTMTANADPDIVKAKLNLVISVGLGPRWKEDEYLAKYACIAVQKLRRKPISKDGQLAQNSSAPRLPNDHIIFEKLRDLVMDQSIPHSRWFSPAEQAINAIYLLSEHPDKMCTAIVKELSTGLFPQKHTGEGKDVSENAVSSSLLNRFFFVVGHVALKQLVHIEEIQAELRRRRAAAKEESDKASKEKRKGVDADNIEQELGTEAAAAETEVELMQEMAERELVGKSLLGRFGPIIAAVCTNASNNFNDPGLQVSAILALCKFMCVNSDFCDNHMQLLFTILQRSPDPSLRSNIVIAFGDLAFRFPNVVEPWSSHIYDRLKDSDARVRKTTVMVLTHLILNDMIRVKGQISEMAMCLEDKEQRIADMAHLFFYELSQKGNALYNILPDAIGKLSSDNRVSAETFDSIMKYLFSFIQKERQSESLVEKLCLRFRTSSELQEWRCIAFCLSLLNYNDKSIKKLIEHFKCYQDKLSDEEIFESFSSIVAKTKKFTKQELKASLEEFERKLASSQIADEGENDATTSKSEGSKRPRPKPRKNRRKDESDASEDFEEDSDGSDLHKKEATAKPTQKSKSLSKKQENADSDVEMVSVSEEDDGPQRRRARIEKAAKRPAKKKPRKVKAVSGDAELPKKRRATKPAAKSKVSAPPPTRPTRSTRARVQVKIEKDDQASSASSSSNSSGDDDDY